MSESGYEIVCNSCRAAVASDARSCPQCGEQMLQDASAPSPGVGFVPSPIGVAAVGYGSAAPGAGYELPMAFMSPPRPRELRYGGFWIRVGAYLIDSLVIGFTLIVAQYFVGEWVALLWVASLLYFPIMESGAGQGTVGKQALNLRVTDLQGRRLSFARALGRTFAKVLSSFLLCIGYLMVALNRRKRALHDVVAGTLVVRG
jgi:uncharacterized RDD family membrane protein YckC